MVTGTSLIGVRSMVTLPGPAQGLMSEEVPPSTSVQFDGDSSSPGGEPVEMSAGGGRVGSVGVVWLLGVVPLVGVVSLSFPFVHSEGRSLLQNQPRQQVFFFRFRFSSRQGWAGSSREHPHLYTLDPSLRILRKFEDTDSFTRYFHLVTITKTQKTEIFL